MARLRIDRNDSTGVREYDAVAERLADLRAVAIDLPGNDGAAGLADDAAAVRAALDGIGERPLVVSHSYGGATAESGRNPSTEE